MPKMIEIFILYELSQAILFTANCHTCNQSTQPTNNSIRLNFILNTNVAATAVTT